MVARADRGGARARLNRVAPSDAAAIAALRAASGGDTRTPNGAVLHLAVGRQTDVEVRLYAPTVLTPSRGPVEVPSVTGVPTTLRRLSSASGRPPGQPRLSASIAFVTPEAGRDEAARDIVLATPRLILTTWLPVDVDALSEVHSEPETMKFVRHGRPESRVETEELVNHYMAEQVAQGWTKWRLADIAGELVGRAGFGGTATHRGLSFAIRRSHWGLGLATEIAEALVAWHLSHAAAVPLRAIVAVGNEASGRVLLKVGFREVGTEDHDGTPCRSFVYPSPE